MTMPVRAPTSKETSSMTTTRATCVPLSIDRYSTQRTTIVRIAYSIPNTKRHSPLRRSIARTWTKAAGEIEGEVKNESRIGEDAAAFNFSEQSVQSWLIFGGLLSAVLGALYIVWINPRTGYADEFLSLLQSFDASPEIIMTCLLMIFGISHSGLAALRPQGERWIGARAYRVLFALTSLPLAALTVGYFINHRYQGMQLWMIQDVPGIRPLVWLISFVSFWFLYPSTFNLLEVAAVDEPRLHLWETGITRITRHPQAVGQGLWCLAHTLWIGNSFMVVTSLGLMVHHAFGCWHGDIRLAQKHGEAFEAIKARTSTLPFQAILEGRQILPKDYYKEFLRVPYLVIVFFTLGTYLIHPLMFRAVYALGW